MNCDNCGEPMNGLQNSFFWWCETCGSLGGDKEGPWQKIPKQDKSYKKLREACETIEQLGVSRYRDLRIDKMVRAALTQE